MTYSVSMDAIQEKILFIRGQKVLLDRDLAAMYGVTTRALNQAVKRNSMRFPPDFMFSLSASEKKELVTNCDRFKRTLMLPVNKVRHIIAFDGAALLLNELWQQGRERLKRDI